MCLSPTNSTDNNTKVPEINSTNKARMLSKTKNGAYKILAAQKDAVTRIAGVITPEAINNLKNEIGKIFTILKSTHFNKDNSMAT